MKIISRGRYSRMFPTEQRNPYQDTKDTNFAQEIRSIDFLY